MSQIVFQLDADLAKKFNALIDTYGHKDLMVEKFIEFHKKKLKREISAIEIDLRAFEDKYGMTSENFYSQFEKRLLEDSEDFILWSGLFELNKENLDHLSKLS